MRTIKAILNAPSGVAVGFISLNVLLMLWHDAMNGGLTMADAAVIGTIFAAKTAHGIATYDKN
jgi:hypothetical protein